MSDEPIHGPPREQQICVQCGFCCDATLFFHATLRPGEKDSLPPLIDAAWYKEGEEEYFRLPCGYFDEKCTIYDRKRAEVCGSFRCQLLKSVASGEMSAEGALTIIRNAREMRDALFSEFRGFTDCREKLWFKKILQEAVKRSEKEDSPTLEMFIARCNIFESLQVRYFRPPDEFDSMVASDPAKTEICNPVSESPSEKPPQE